MGIYNTRQQQGNILILVLIFSLISSMLVLPLAQESLLTQRLLSSAYQAAKLRHIAVPSSE